MKPSHSSVQTYCCHSVTASVIPYYSSAAGSSGTTAIGLSLYLLPPLSVASVSEHSSSSSDLGSLSSYSLLDSSRLLRRHLESHLPFATSLYCSPRPCRLCTAAMHKCAHHRADCWQALVDASALFFHALRRWDPDLPPRIRFCQKGRRNTSGERAALSRHAANIRCTLLH